VFSALANDFEVQPLSREFLFACVMQLERFTCKSVSVMDMCCTRSGQERESERARERERDIGN
jgi:hypothetical protein